MKTNLKKITGMGIGGFVILGIVNAFIISNHSELGGEITYVKGLDEMYGITQPGRVLATHSAWKKIETDKSAVSVSESSDKKNIEVQPPGPAIAEDLKLNLVEVVNPKLWSKGLPTTEFEGDLETSNGRIENLSISLPEKEAISITYAEMNGHVFEYDFAGEIYSGMLYQVDPKSYMITLTNGPLEGTRLRFVEGFSDEQNEIKETLKEEHNLEVGFFGDNQPVKENKSDKAADPALVEAQMMNMEAQV